jgi:hypothetical protein
LFSCGVGMAGSCAAKVDLARSVRLLNVTQKNYSGGLLLV